MARYKPRDYSQTQLVPVSLSDQLVPGTLEHTIHYVVEERLDLSAFDAEFNNEETGRRAYDPRVLLKVVLFGYARGLKGSRQLEAACRENITFMALACGQGPDHSTFAAFISGMGRERIEDLFAQVLLVCAEEGLLGGTHFAIDGCRMSSNASKEWSGKRSDLIKKRDKLRALVREAMEEHRRIDGGEDGGRGGGDRRRLERLQKKAERIERFLAENPARVGRQGKEVQANVTDNESAKMKSSHGIVQGYNANACVDGAHQVVVHAEAFSEGDDGAAAAPMLEGAAVNLAIAGMGEDALQEAAVSADTGYYTVENLGVCAAAGVDAYIPDRQFRSRDPRFADARRHRRPTDKHKSQYRSQRRFFCAADFRFDESSGRLICPAGVRMHRSGTAFKNRDGAMATSYRAAQGACDRCALRSKCLRDPRQKSSRQVRVFYRRGSGGLTHAMKAKIDTPLGRRIYSRRLGIVEPVFANIAAQKGLDRFTLRGRAKVNIQWKLYCMVHNLEKIARRGRWN